jgi:DegV family protein with EDD domain
MPVRIVTDSTSDLPPALAAAHAITVVPLTVSFGEESFLDGVEIDAPAFYARMRTFPGVPTTSQPSVARFQEAYEAAGAQGCDVVSIHVSSRLSGTLNSATLAAAGFEGRVRIVIVDSENVSMGLAGIVLAAAEAAERGSGVDAVVEVARATIPCVRVVAALDTLEYLRRGGRIGRARSLLGSILHIKPMIQVEHGEVAPFDRVRTRERAIQRLVEIATADPDIPRLFVASAGDDAGAQALAERIRLLLPNTEIIVGQLGPVVGAHSGPGLLGVCTVRRP